MYLTQTQKGEMPLGKNVFILTKSLCYRCQQILMNNTIDSQLLSQFIQTAGNTFGNGAH